MLAILTGYHWLFRQNTVLFDTFQASSNAVRFSIVVLIITSLKAVGRGMHHKSATVIPFDSGR